MLSGSRQLMIACLSFIVGAYLGSRWQLPWETTIWLLAIWLILWLSGQIVIVETLAIVLTSGLAGMLVWHLTGGESWLNWPFLAQISQVLENWRDLLVDKILLVLPEPHGSLIVGILFGNRLKLSPELTENFRAVGLSHLIAVSGYNLTILTANVRHLFGFVELKWRLLIALTIIVAFVILTGAPPSILRAAVMAATLLVAEAVGRPSRSLNLLILAAALLTVFQPKIILEIGFQLSLAATYGLVRLAPLIERTLGKLPKVLGQILSETLAATLMTAPLIIGYFERLSVVSPLTNLLVVPLIPLLMAIGLVGVGGLLIWPLGGMAILWLGWPILSWIILISRQVGAWPQSTSEISLPAVAVVGLMVLLIAGVEWLTWRAKRANPIDE